MSSTPHSIRSWCRNSSGGALSVNAIRQSIFIQEVFCSHSPFQVQFGPTLQWISWKDFLKWVVNPSSLRWRIASPCTTTPCTASEGCEEPHLARHGLLLLRHQGLLPPVRAARKHGLHEVLHQQLHRVLQLHHRFPSSSVVARHRAKGSVNSLPLPPPPRLGFRSRGRGLVGWGFVRRARSTPASELKMEGEERKAVREEMERGGQRREEAVRSQAEWIWTVRRVG
jgi:hypothetical protein